MGLMDKQMQAFALGGLKDEGGEIDEASGNRVPIGGTKEGVRDDIPANVSEGEFIFPADVVRYHGLDKMMALRQEAKIGLRKMESMGQMGNSEEASMPDDLPFEMADLIVVGGQGEPMEFAEGGFVPQMQTLQTAAVPTMGGGTSTGTQTPIVYDDFMKTPVVTMQEYRDANGNSIIITSVNGKATTAVPDGYTLYTPPANTAPTTTQAAIQTVNRRSYRPTGDNEGPEPQPDQPAPDYGSMDDNDYFNAMAEQNSFGGKVGSAAATAIGFMIGGPVGLLVSTLMRNDKNNQIASMKGRIDGMQPGSAKDRAQAIYDEYRGETDPEKKQGLFSRVTDYLGGIVGDVAGAIGISQEDAAKVTRNATVAEINGTTIDVEQALTAPATIPVNVTPTADQTRPQLRPDEFPTVSDTIKKYPKGNRVSDQIASPLVNNLSTEANQGMAPAPARTSTPVTEKDPVGYGIGQVDPRLAAAQEKAQEKARNKKYFVQDILARNDAYNTYVDSVEGSEQARADAARERSLNMPGTPLARSNKNKSDTSSATAPRTNVQAGDYRSGVKFGTDALQDRVDESGQALDSMEGQMDQLGSLGDRYKGRVESGDIGSSFTGEVGNQYALDSNRANDAAVTETGISREPRGVTFVTPKNSRQVLANEAKNANIAKNTAGSGYDAMATANIPPAVAQQVPVAVAQSNASGDPSEDSTAFEDPRETINPDPMNTGTYSNDGKSLVPSQISDSQLSLGQARNAEPRDMYGRSPVDQTSSAFNLSPSNLASQYGNYGRGKIGQTGTPFSIDPYNSPTSTPTATDTNLTDEKRRQQSQKNITGKAKRTSKGTGTRKAAPTGDDRLSQANFLERALGITPAKVGARRGNDGVLYRTQADKREADKRQEDAKVRERNSARAVARRDGKLDAFNKKYAKDIEKRHGGEKEDTKIVCTEMYRQTQLVDWQHTMKIWHVYQEKHLTPYHQVGYHWLFKPYVRGMKNSSILTKLGAALAKHRTEHLRYILTKGKAKDNLIGNVWCKFVHPLVYIAGIIKEKIGK